MFALFKIQHNLFSCTLVVPFLNVCPLLMFVPFYSLPLLSARTAAHKIHPSLYLPPSDRTGVVAMAMGARTRAGVVRVSGAIGLVACEIKLFDIGGRRV